MKYTAWPAFAIVAVMVAARDGVRPAVRFAAGVLAAAAGLVAALAPAALRHPASILENTVAYPLGLTAAKSPAQSPLPGHLLATLGPAGHAAALVLLAAAGLATAASLVLCAAGHPRRRRAAARHRADRAVPAVPGDALRLLHLPDQPVRVGGSRGRGGGAPGAPRDGRPGAA